MSSIMKKLGMVAVAVALVLASVPAFAKNPAKNMNPETGECVVTENSWEGVYDGKLSLKAAMWYANSTDPKWTKWCQKKISIDVVGDRLGMTTPLEIVGGGQGFVVEGKDEAVTLDAKALTGKGHECAVIINGSGVILNKLKITNVPEDMKAICVNEPDAEFQSVEVTHGMFGIDFAEDVIGGVVGMDASVKITGKGYAVNLGGSEGSLSTNRIVPMDTEGRETDKNGMILPKDGEKKIYVSAPTIDQFIKSNSDIGVCIKRTTELVSGAYSGMIRVEGFVQDASGVLNQDIVRLQVYDGKGFRGYVGEYNSTHRVGMGSTKIVGGSAGAKTGSFKFYIKKDVENSEIILFPEDVSHNVGASSQKIKLVGSSVGGCSDKGLGSAFEDGTDGGESGVSGDKRLSSIQHCRMMRGITEPGETGIELGMDYDTDGDGIADDLEDVNFNCEYDSSMGETSWYRSDSDLDGIPDGTGGEKGCLEWKRDAETLIPTECSKFDDPDGDGLSNALDSDSDGDGRPDGVEDRNDAVVFTAGTTALPGVLYMLGTSAIDPVMIGGEVQECDLGVGRQAGVSYPWYMLKWNGSQITSAVKLGNDIPESGTPEDEQKTTRTEVRSMICRLQSLMWSQNFNGVYDQGNNETNPFSDVELADGTVISAVDTDNDGFCDGNGSGGKCPNMAEDKCPTVPGKNTTDGCGKDLPCLPMQALFTTDPKYVEQDGAGMPTGLKINPETNQPVIFELKDEKGRPDYKTISTLCSGDFDKDGVPDCVENPFVSASCEDSQTGLKFNREDSDGDNLIDGMGKGAGETRVSDVCPASKGTDDKFAEGKKSYSCDPRQVYKLRPILSCFFDRDGDGLRDCEEDLDMDGNYNSNQNPGIKIVDGQVMLTEEELAKIETDALAKDTDGDSLDDMVERTRPVKSVDGVDIYTNPAHEDTDSDGLTDGDEDRNGDGLFTINIQAKGSDGCPQLADLKSFDTDPTRKDSDGDKIDDKLELSGGSFNAGNPFLALIGDVELLKSGIALISDPMTTDSDGDGLVDGQEYAGGKVYYYDSNPCMHDSDKDGKKDQDELVGCALSADPTCRGNGTFMRDKTGEPGSVDTSKGIDSDSDGLSDSCEAKLGTDAANNDTDSDGLLDGQEVSEEDCVYTPGKLKPEGEYKYVTDPFNADTDGDGLNDYLEYKYGTDPTIADTDGDCITDGMEDANRNGKWDAGETNALSADTDGDGLPDGLIRGIGEDMNCNGLRDQNANGSWTETDPTNPDSDFDSVSDFEEMMSGGWNPSANVARATSGAGEGCSMSGAGAAPSGMIYLLGMLLVGTKLSARRMKRKEN